jgi:holin-like protein
MIAALAGIFLCQLLGELVCRLFALPLPGPVVGMGLLFAFLLARGGQGKRAVPKPLGAISDQLLGHLSLLFVPATVGMMRYFDVLAQNALLLAVTLVVSTALTLAATALTFRLLTRDRA